MEFPQDQDRLQQEKLTTLLRDLAKSQEVLNQSSDLCSFYERLEDIYYIPQAEKFRHYYSDIFSTLTLIDENPDLGNLDILTQNIRIIRNGYVPQHLDDQGVQIDVTREIVKLYDHVNLDVARIRYAQNMFRQYQSGLARNEQFMNNQQKEFKKQAEKLRTIVEDNIDQVDNLSNDIKNNQKEMQKEYIVILGIFASIILTFTAGFAFSGAVLENIAKVSIYRLIAVTLIIALFFFNLIWMLLCFISGYSSAKESAGFQGKVKWIFWSAINLTWMLGIVGIYFAYKYAWLG